VPGRIHRSVVSLSACLALFLAPGAPAHASEALDPLQPLVAAYERAATPGAEADTYRSLLERVMRRVQRSYPLEVDPAPLVAAGIRAIDGLGTEAGKPAVVFKRALSAALAALDPHSSVMDAAEYTRFRSSLLGSFAGLGLKVEMAGGLVRVIAPIENSPTARAGLQSGDLIVRFDD
jgi:C-terminal processing protease CtpA/Prc